MQPTRSNHPGHLTKPPIRPSTRWATDSVTKQAWSRFELQDRKGDAWKTVLTGDKIGSNFTRTFPAVTAHEFRLNILDATDGPTIAEIELLEK